MLDTGASSSIINYRTFWEICQTQQPISVKRSTIQTKTFSGQVAPMIGLATSTFSYDPDGQFTFPLTAWITEMKTQNLLGMDFCQKQVSGIHFELPGIELKQPPKTVCYGSLHQNKSYSFISRILTIRTPHAMHIEAKSARCWKYSPEDPHAHFPPGSTFQPNRNAIATRLPFFNVLCTQSESKLPILMENNKNHQITLPKGRIGFSSLDIFDKDEPRHQIRDPYELTNAIFSTNEQYNDCFLLHSTIPSQLPDEFLQIVYGNENSILQHTQSESKLPILMENNKNHQITLPKGRIGFSSLDIFDKDEPRHQIRDPHELTNAIFSTNEQYNDCFLLHSTIPSQLPDEFLQKVYGNENSILQQPNSIGHCIFADAQLSKGFAQFLSERVPRLRRTCRRANLLKDQVFPFWDSSSRRYIYNLVTKEKYLDKPDLQTLATTLQSMQSHATMHGVSTIAIPKIGCGLDQMNWQDVVKLLRDIFAYSDVQIVVYSLDEHAIHAMSAEGDPEFYAEDEIDRYSEGFHLNERELETDFTSDAKSCQPDCDEQFPILRPKEQKEALIEHYLQYQP